MFKVSKNVTASQTYVRRVKQVDYTVSQKNDTDVTHYRFNPHQPISVIFGRDVLREYAIEW